MPVSESQSLYGPDFETLYHVSDVRHAEWPIGKIEISCSFGFTILITHILYEIRFPGKMQCLYSLIKLSDLSWTRI